MTHFYIFIRAVIIFFVFVELMNFLMIILFYDENHKPFAADNNYLNEVEVAINDSFLFIL